MENVSKPHDFYALRELMLSAAYLNDMDELALDAEAKHFSYNSKKVKEVIESASGQDKNGNTMLYLLTGLFMGFVPSIIYFFAGAVIFRGRAVAAEFQRRFHL